MKVSLITICYNNELVVENTIRSVINQTYRDIEYIIVDGLSKDRTLCIVEEFKNHITRIISEKDEGIYDAINKGILASTGEIVGLIHAGDELHDCFVVENVVSCFKENNVDALYGHSKVLSEDGLRVVRLNKSPTYRRKLFRIGWFPSHQSFYAKRSLFDLYGIYNISYKIAADYELLFRFMYKNKIKVRLLDKYIIKFKLGGTSTKSVYNILYQNYECIKAWYINGYRIPLYTIPLKFFRKSFQYLNARMLKYEKKKF